MLMVFLVVGLQLPSILIYTPFLTAGILKSYHASVLASEKLLPSISKFFQTFTHLTVLLLLQFVVHVCASSEYTSTCAICTAHPTFNPAYIVHTPLHAVSDCLPRRSSISSDGRVVGGGGWWM